MDDKIKINAFLSNLLIFKITYDGKCKIPVLNARNIEKSQFLPTSSYLAGYFMDSFRLNYFSWKSLSLVVRELVVISKIPR